MEQSAAVTEVDALWREAYDGEVSGETFFGAMADAVGDEGRRAKLELITRLEVATREAMIPAMAARGLPVGLDPVIAEAGTAFGVALAAEEWTSAMATIEQVTERYLGIYRAMLEHAGDELERSTAQLVVDHEVALQTFARREKDGQPQDSVALVEALPHLR